MRIISKDEFMQIEGYVLYHNVHKGEISPELYIKTGNCGDYEPGNPGGGSWFYTQLDGSGPIAKETREHDGSGFRTVPVKVGDKITFETCGERDGFYEPDDVFAVYERDDIKVLIEAARACLTTEGIQTILSELEERDGQKNEA